MKLTIHPTMQFRDGPQITGTGPVIAFRVGGVPNGQQADIATFNQVWRILRVINGVQGEWTGEYATADDALAALERVLVDEAT